MKKNESETMKLCTEISSCVCMWYLGSKRGLTYVRHILGPGISYFVNDRSYFFVTQNTIFIYFLICLEAISGDTSGCSQLYGHESVPVVLRELRNDGN